MHTGPRTRILLEGLRGTIALLLIPAALLAAAYLLGSRLPGAHTATATGLLDAPPEHVWELLNDIAAQSTWRQVPMVIVRTRFDASTGDTCWFEGWVLTKFLLCSTNTGQAHRVIQTTGPFQPFAATWTFDLTSAPDNRTAITITERSSIPRPLWRFLGAYILRRHTAAQYYLATLQHEAAHRYPTPPR